MGRIEWDGEGEGEDGKDEHNLEKREGTWQGEGKARGRTEGKEQGKYCLLFIKATSQWKSLKTCLHLIRFNALTKLVSEPVPSEAHQCALMRFGTSTLFYLHIIWLQSTASGFPLSCFTGKEKCNFVNDSWKHGSTGSTPTQACFSEKASAKAEEDTLSWNARVIWEEFFQNIPLCTFISLAACQWKREDDVDSILGERSPTNSSKYKVAPKYCYCTICMLGVIPRASMNNALSTARLAVCEERRGKLRDGGPCQGALLISFLLAVVSLIMW